MGLIRILLLGLILYIAWQLVKRTLKPPAPTNPAARDQAAKMLRCEECGVHVPENLARWHKGHSFCCKEHSDAWQNDSHN